MKKLSEIGTSGTWVGRAAVAGVLVTGALVIPVVATQAGTAGNSSDADAKIGLLRGNSDGLGSYDRGELASAGWQRAAQVDPSLAHRADTGSSRWKVWLGGSGRNACMYFALPGSSTASAACGPASEMAAGRMAITHTGGGADPAVTVIGVVPDGVSSVTVRSGGGADTSDVQDNVFVASTDTSAKSYSYDGPAGARTVSIHVDK